MAAARSVQVVFANLTPENLILTSSNLLHGIWSPEQAPPKTITKYSKAIWQSESDGFMTGAQGNASYAFQTDASQVVTVNWDNPYSGSNDFSANAPKGFDATTTSASGDRATVTVVLTPV